MADVVIPKMGMTMQEATLVTWLRPDGAVVEVGEPIFVLATDKLEAEVEAEVAGTLRHAVEPGVTLPVGGVLGWLQDGDPAPEARAPEAHVPAPHAATTAAPVVPTSTPASTAPAASNGGHAEPAVVTGRVMASPNARRLSRQLGVELVGLVGTGPGGRIVGADVEAAVRQPSPLARTGPRASAAARRLAGVLGLDLAEVAGAEPAGELTRQDVEAFAAARLAASPGRPPRPEGPPAEQVVERIPLAGRRGVIARRMHESLAEMAQLTITTQATVTRLLKLRDRLKREGLAGGQDVPTITDFVVKAAALALRQHPRLNARVVSGAIEVLDAVHIGVAVAVTDGILVPVVRDADGRRLVEVSADRRLLSERARADRLAPDDLEGATFTVTSLGTAGVDAFTPVVNPPNVAILGVGRVVDGVRWKGHGKQARPHRTRQLTLSLTFDHRAVDGSPAAAFLAGITERLAAPHQLL